MKKSDLLKMWMRAACFAFVAVLVSSCANDGVDSAPPQQPGESGESGAIEEIIVTGAKVGGREQSRRAWRKKPAVVERDMSVVAAVAPRFHRNETLSLSSVAPGEELWIIARVSLEAQGTNARTDDSPGSGAMVARPYEPGHEPTDRAGLVPLPLKHTAVDASISGYISTVNVRQQFQNPFDEKIEAVYMFPLPEKAAVSEFLMIIGERRIRGILREKEEAKAIYEEARRQGYQASLLVQRRPNIFEQKVANIEPGKGIDVDIKYFHTLAYQDGWYSFVFPTVVGPRYNPPHSKDPIHAVANGERTQPGGGTAARYLRPAERSAHDISINVDINAGVTIEDVRSSHRISTSHHGAETTRVQLANHTTIPNRDFVLEFQVAGERMKSKLLTHVDPGSGQGYFTLMMYPPADFERIGRQPMEMVFVLDCSGSMRGRPLTQAKNAVRAALDHLQPEDTFQIIRFSDNASQFGRTPVAATRQNIADARGYLKLLRGTGGTHVLQGVRTALDFPHDPKRLRFVTFMTDGYIGNEAEIIEAVHSGIGDSRIFSFGVGSSVNRYLMERMAKEGRGAVAYLSPSDSARKIMASFFERISHPALTDIQIDWGGMNVADVYPARTPDVFVGRPVVITGKYLGAPDDVIVRGLRDSEQHSFRIAAGRVGQNASISKVWARLKIADLGDRQAWESDPYDELASEIRNTALEHQLMSAYTSFVAVDASRRTEGRRGTTVHQGVPVPHGVRYDTTVGKN
ncbi:MAG: VIT and VWA domain-containing protein [Gammaproteobacteria bacterium]|nr:VIT and VWA domain-containing protein [Gammaproteobacteria bacterium]